MSTDLRQALHQAAAAPSDPLDLERLLARGRRRRRNRRIGAAAGSLVTLGVLASVGLAIPRTVVDGPPLQPSVAPGPVPFAELPAGWTELPAPPEARWAPASAWTGEQLLVWGGEGSGTTGTPRADGFRFDPRAGGWDRLAPSPLAPRLHPASAWSGRELLVWGGVGRGIRKYDDGAAYDPAQDRWRPLPPAPISARVPLSVWTGTELVVWGTAVRRADIPTDGAAYDPASDSWRRIADGPVELTDATAVWTGTEMIVFGAALNGDNVAATGTAIGAAYDPATDSWRRIPDSTLSPQASTAAWNGEELVAWDYQIEAAAYRPAENRWRPLPRPPLDPMECYPASVPTGADTFGELCGGMVVFDPGEDRWQDVTRDDLEVQAMGFELVAAGPVVVLIGRSIDGGPTTLAYRHRP